VIVINTDVINANGTAYGNIEARESGTGKLLHSDRFDLTSSRSRKMFANAVTNKIKSPESVDEIERLLLVELERRRAEAPSEGSQPSGYVDHEALLNSMPQQVRDDAEAMLRDPYLLRRVRDDIAAVGVAGEKKLTVALYLTGTSRLSTRPNAVIVQGHTSSGKTHAAETTAKLFPPEDVILVSQMTPQALFHMVPHSLEHRFIVAGERSRLEDDGRAEATRALREMLSSGKLRKLIPEKDEHGQIVTKLIEQDGPVAYVETTTLNTIFDEDANRCILLTTDEGQEQTRRIMVSHAEFRSGQSPDTQPIIDRHHAAQRILTLDAVPVVTPYARKLAELFPAERPEARRAFGHTLSLIESSALLYMRQRDRDADRRIVATQDDYAVARAILSDSLARTLGKALSAGARGLHERLNKWVEISNEFTSSDVYRKENFSERHVRNWLIELGKAGWITVLESGRGKPSRYRLEEGTETDESSPLPDPDQVCGEAATKCQV
jgi:hypothetical protein